VSLSPQRLRPRFHILTGRSIIRPARDRSDDSSAAITHDMTFRNPTLKAQTPFVKPPFYVDYGLRVRIGGSTFINRSCMIMDTPVADVIIGERCNIGPNCCIVSVGHALRAEERAGKQSSIGKPITIGDHVWIGANVTVL
jgi:acetyltransferase-like isoleucine patch superfamily enzyme